MKCQYTFLIRGELLAAHTHPVSIGEWFYEFLMLGDRVSALRITVRFPPDYPFPSVVSPASGRPAHFKVVAPLYGEVVGAARTTFGLLAFHEAFDIETGAPEIQYVPESELELQQLTLFGARREPPKPIRARLQFRHLLQCLLASRPAAPYEFALTFFRRAQLAIHDQLFIEAIYNLFFVLESQFGAGKSSRRGLLQAFLAAPILVSCIEALREDPESLLSKAPPSWAYSVAGVLDHFILLRGKLHHHSSSSSRPWHPESHDTYRAECGCLVEIVTEVLIRVAAPAMFTPETKAQMRALCPHEWA